MNEELLTASQLIARLRAEIEGLKAVIVAQEAEIENLSAQVQPLIRYDLIDRSRCETIPFLRRYEYHAGYQPQEPVGIWNAHNQLRKAQIKLTTVNIRSRKEEKREKRKKLIDEIDKV